MVINLNSNIHNVVTIIQARMNSKRLPGKVLKPIVNKPMIELLLTRLSKSSELLYRVKFLLSIPPGIDLKSFKIFTKTESFESSLKAGIGI